MATQLDAIARHLSSAIRTIVRRPALGLTLVSMAATIVPTLRASRISPKVAIASE